VSDQVDPVMTIEELSKHVKVPKSTLYKLVKEGKIPCQKIGKHWRFNRDAIDRWLMGNTLETIIKGGE